MWYHWLQGVDQSGFGLCSGRCFGPVGDGYISEAV